MRKKRKDNAGMQLRFRPSFVCYFFYDLIIWHEPLNVQNLGHGCRSSRIGSGQDLTRPGYLGLQFFQTGPSRPSGVNGQVYGCSTDINDPRIKALNSGSRLLRTHGEFVCHLSSQCDFKVSSPESRIVVPQMISHRTNRLGQLVT